jgi:hypothetical protein
VDYAGGVPFSIEGGNATAVFVDYAGGVPFNIEGGNLTPVVVDANNPFPIEGGNATAVNVDYAGGVPFAIEGGNTSPVVVDANLPFPVEGGNVTPVLVSQNAPVQIDTPDKYYIGQFAVTVDAVPKVTTGAIQLNGAWKKQVNIWLRWDNITGSPGTFWIEPIAVATGFGNVVIGTPFKFPDDYRPPVGTTALIKFDTSNFAGGYINNVGVRVFNGNGTFDVSNNITLTVYFQATDDSTISVGP